MQPQLHILSDRYTRWSPPPSIPVELDLGCGKGGFLLRLAHRFPDRAVIGADVMLGRLRKVLRKVERQKLSNVALLRVSAWDLIGHTLPDHGIHRIHILHPDPWPKARHRSKRLVTSEFLGRVVTKLVPGGTLHFSTDDDPYVSFVQEAIRSLDCYEPDATAIADIADIKTDFELEFEKAGKRATHLAFRVRGR